MPTKPLLIIIAVLTVIGLGALLFMSPAAPSEDTASNDALETTPVLNGAGTEISYGADGFSPASITVPVGTTVTWTNAGEGRMWVGADEHPTHTSYDGSSTREHCVDDAPASADVFDQCTASGSYRFTFTKAGTWEYHNHANASHRGTVVVTEAGEPAPAGTIETSVDAEL